MIVATHSLKGVFSPKNIGANIKINIGIVKLISVAQVIFNHRKCGAPQKHCAKKYPAPYNMQRDSGSFKRIWVY